MRRPWWTVKCPVCGEELPERGNRRVYVPWKRGFRLVHADDCAGLIEAQGVLDVTPPQPKLRPVQAVRARQHAENLRYLKELVRGRNERVVPVEHHVLMARKFASDFIRRQPVESEHDATEKLLKIVRPLRHLREYSDPTGRLLA